MQFHRVLHDKELLRPPCHFKREKALKTRLIHLFIKQTQERINRRRLNYISGKMFHLSFSFYLFSIIPYTLFISVYITLSKFEKTCASTFLFKMDEPPATEENYGGSRQQSIPCVGHAVTGHCSRRPTEVRVLT